jgi:serine/threonine protein kinase
MELAGKHIGNYVAKQELGSGGMGVVYLCEHPLIRRRVAAKVLHEELALSEEIVRRLFAEAKAANEIDSEHIIEVLDFGRISDNGRELVYLLMEFLEGEGLGHRLWRIGLTIEESLHIVAQCCSALEASHKVGIVHRDLKPENIFLLERRGDPNFVKILDFGIAKVSGSPSTKTRTGVLLGTPAYMSPEQCRGSGAVDARADVYSLGIVLYELCTGDVPFNAEGYGQVLLAQMTEPPPPPSSKNKDLPKVVEAVILRALEKDPAKRYQSMSELGRAIAEAENFLGSRTPVAQIPRKGLHQRETVLRAERKAGSVENALRKVAPTPVDPTMAAQMANISVEGATQRMEAVDPAEVGRVATLRGTGDADAQATVLDQRLPTHVRQAIAESEAAMASTELKPAPQAVAKVLEERGSSRHSEPATEMRRDGAGNLTTGPQGMVAPRPRSDSVPTVLSAQAPTAVREAVPLPEQHRPTSTLITPRRTGLVILVLLLLGAAGAALTLLMRR